MSSPSYDVRAFREFEFAGWQQVASNYDTFFEPISQQIAAPVLDAAHVTTGTALLDIATGPGYLAAIAAARGATAIGVDIAASMVDLATAKYPNARFEVGDAEHLTFADANFDAVVGSFVLPHLTNHLEAVRGWIRVLRPGGWLAQAMWAPPDQTRIAGLFLDAARIAGAVPPKDLPAGPPFFAFSTDDALTGLHRDAGLDEVMVRSIELHRVVASADELWNGMLNSTVRTQTTVLGQTPDVQRRIRAVFDDLAAQYQSADGLAIPITVKIVSGRKPG
ncbi:MAG TPA: class I SAM-dependent methyltransferase [Thermomicrobiales bacterium]|nr:class I SAM-dependent methyltransferase [Thermomicrobiales bacterium]